jgi:hypothetical protein
VLAGEGAAWMLFWVASPRGNEWIQEKETLLERMSSARGLAGRGAFRQIDLGIAGFKPTREATFWVPGELLYRCYENSSPS